jgi:Zn-dependent protease/CBS domain-containing protein
MPEERTDRPAPGGPRPWSIRIATVAGIPIRLHITFFLGLLYFGLNGRTGASLDHIALVLALFGCVVLHELGHSLVALHYGIPVRDITLYPIGGVAVIEKRPQPRQELWIALAGPAVNVVIAFALLIAMGHPTGPNMLAYASAHKDLFWLFEMNVMLVAFNAIPALPMDGGRVLRAILAMAMPVERATSIAAGIGQVLAVLFGILAIVLQFNPILMLIAFFIYIGAGQEAMATSQEAMLEGVQASQAMITDVRTLAVGDTLREAAEVLLSTSQHDFPVVHGDTVQGILTRNGLLRALAAEGPNAYVAGAMDRDFVSVAPDDDLASALPHLQGDQSPVLVIDPRQNGKLMGLISGENVAEFFAVRRITARRDRLAV